MSPVQPLSLLLAASLSFSVPAQMSLAATTAAVDDEEDAYKAAKKALEKANANANKDPKKHMSALADAIEAVEAFPRQLADDSDGARLLELASLNLSRALLRSGDRASAAEVMDDLLRKSAGEKLPVQRFGPTLVEFHDARVAALQVQGTAELQFKCEVSCRVLLDRRTVTSRSGELYLGSYEIAIESMDGSLPAEEQTIELDEAGTVLMVRYPMAGLEVEEEEGPPPRIMPRWAEGLLIGVGVAALGTASGLLAMDGRCVGGVPPVDGNGAVCPQLFETGAIGATVLGVGAAMLGAGVVTLTVDERRLRADADERELEAMIHWRVNF